MNTIVTRLKCILQEQADPAKALSSQRFFKNSANDIFLGIAVPVLRKIAKMFSDASFNEILVLMQSDVHEIQTIAYFILCLQFKKADEQARAQIFNFYISSRHYIHDWDGVDATAPYIVGAYLLNNDKTILYELAHSDSLWDRRIAIVSTWWFIRNNHFSDTLKLAKILLYDQEDLIHKATGWMLRELGKRSPSDLREFLDQNHLILPRTTLRYAIEKFSVEDRRYYLRAPLTIG